jgi:glyoxylase-like metal-dependent hydrolase (beta-lactamase superfamily II)
MHTPGHTEGSISLHDRAAGIVYSGDTLFQGAWGRTDLPGGDDAAMIATSYPSFRAQMEALGARFV